MDLSVSSVSRSPEQSGLRCALVLSTVALLWWPTMGRALDSAPGSPIPATPNETTNAPPEFQIKKGFCIELVAGETLLEAPAAIAFDENGRLFVAETLAATNRNAENPYR